MVRMLVGLVMLAVASAAWVMGLEKYYNHHAFVSAETMQVVNATLMWTAEHRLEEYASNRLVDQIAISIFGMLAGAITAGCAGRVSSRSNMIKAIVAGAVLGLVTGVIAGYAGWLFRANVDTIQNTTIYAVVRTIAMFIPYGLAVGFAASLSGVFKRDASDAIISGVLGVLVAATIYGLAADSNPTTREQMLDVFPRYMRNRVLFATCLSMIPLLAIAAQMLRKPNASAKESAVAGTVT